MSNTSSSSSFSSRTTNRVPIIAALAVLVCVCFVFQSRWMTWSQHQSASSSARSGTTISIQQDSLPPEQQQPQKQSSLLQQQTPTMPASDPIPDFVRPAGRRRRRRASMDQENVTADGRANNNNAPRPRKFPPFSEFAAAVPIPTIVDPNTGGPEWCKPLRDGKKVSHNPLNCSVSFRSSIPPPKKKDERRSRFAIVTLTNSVSPATAPEKKVRLEEMRRISFSNKLAYCERHGYDLVLEDENVGDLSRHGNNLQLAKVLAMRKWLPHYEWIVWLDHDVVIIDMDAKIEDVVVKQVGEMEALTKTGDNKAAILAKYGKRKVYKWKTFADEINLHKKESIDVLYTADPNGINSGVMFVKNCTWSIGFLDRVWGLDYIKGPYKGRNDNDVIPDFLHLFRFRRGIPPPLTTKEQMLEDRAHSFVTENNEWNMMWGYAVGFLYQGVRHIVSDWGWIPPEREEALVVRRPFSHPFMEKTLPYWMRPGAERRRDAVAVHMVACKDAAKACLAWMGYLHERALSMWKLEDVAPEMVPARYFQET